MMEGGVTIQYLDSESPHCRLTKTRVQAEYSARFARRTDPALDATIATFTMAQARRSGSMAYNGPAYRLAGFRETDAGLLLQIGPVDYFEYLALLLDAGARSRLLGPPELGQDYLPNVLGTSGLLVTSDEKVVCVKRSLEVSTYQGFLDLPGGHPEPDLVRQAARGEPLSVEELNGLVLDELFDSIVRETEEETGISRIYLGDPRLLAIVSNRDDLLKPDLVFSLQTSRTAEEVSAAFLQMSPRPEEVDDLVFLDPATPGASDVSPRTPVMERVLGLYVER